MGPSVARAQPWSAAVTLEDEVGRSAQALAGVRAGRAEHARTAGDLLRGRPGAREPLLVSVRRTRLRPARQFTQ